VEDKKSAGQDNAAHKCNLLKLLFFDAFKIIGKEHGSGKKGEQNRGCIGRCEQHNASGQYKNEKYNPQQEELSPTHVSKPYENQHGNQDGQSQINQCFYIEYLKKGFGRKQP